MRPTALLVAALCISTGSATARGEAPGASAKANTIEPSKAEGDSPAPAASSPVADEARAQARELAGKGDHEFSRGRCDKAIVLWKEAEQHFHAPTILLRIARCQALVGNVVEATATYETIAADSVPSDAPPAFLEAKKNAIAELPSVKARVATLTLAVDRKDLDVRPLIQVDEKPRPDGSFAVDPGAHHVRVRAGGALWEQTVHIDDGETQLIRVKLWADKPEPPSHGQRNVGLALGAVGVAGLAVGTAFAVSALGAASDLDAACRDGRSLCPNSERETIDRLDAHALAADLTIAGGAAFLIAGTILVLPEPSPESNVPKLRLAPIGRGAALFGAF